MFDIKNWLLSIIGIIILGSLINIILPESNISKYIKSIYSIIVVFVIINPFYNLIASYLNKNLDLYNLSEDYLSKIYANNENTLIDSIKMKSAQLGISDINVYFMSHISENKLILDKVYVDLQNAFIDEKFNHIDKYQVLENIITTITKIQKENIIYYE